MSFLITIIDSCSNGCLLPLLFFVNYEEVDSGIMGRRDLRYVKVNDIYGFKFNEIIVISIIF